MPRRTLKFHNGSTPIEGDYMPGSATGPFRWMDPSHAVWEGDIRDPEAHATGYKNAHYDRDARKGRRAIIVDRSQLEGLNVTLPSRTGGLTGALKTILSMMRFWDAPLDNISWWTAMVYITGSSLFVMASYIKGGNTQLDYDYNRWFAWAGSAVFAVGAYLMILETINSNRTPVGYHVEPVSDASDVSAKTESKFVPNDWEYNRRFGWSKPDWSWFTKLADFRRRDLGFWATMIQAVSSALFFWANSVSLQPTWRHIAEDPKTLKGAFYFPIFTGCIGFAVAGIILALEMQTRWWKPAYDQIGWHIAMLKFTGACLFIAAGLYAMYEKSYESAMLSLAGSVAFLCGSILLWFEVMLPHPVYYEKADQSQVKGEEEPVNAVD